jgi:hypothetical protein
MKPSPGFGFRVLVCLVVATWSSCATAASATPKQACELVPASAIASDLGMTQVVAREITPPLEPPGGRLTECRIVAWRASKPKARIPNGTMADLTIETGEEDADSPLAAEWAKSGALNLRTGNEAAFENMVEEAEGYVRERHVGPELWDRERADRPGFDLSGYDEISEHGKEAHGRRDIYVTWRSLEQGDRSVSLNMVIDERKRPFVELNAIAEAVVPAFALSPAEFGTPAAPAPEMHERPLRRYKPCPRAVVIDSDGHHLEHFEVIGTSCATAEAVMRAVARTGHAPAGWKLTEPGMNVEGGHKGRARFLCYDTTAEN